MEAAFSKTLIAGEKTSLCCAATLVLCCMVATILAVLGLGIGLGYNHCFVDMKTRYKYVPAHYVYEGSHRGQLRSAADDEAVKELLDGVEETLNAKTLPIYSSSEVNPFNNSSGKMSGWDSFLNTTNSYTNASFTTTINSIENESDYEKSELKFANGTKTEIIPIVGLNLIDLIAKLKEANNNYSIQIIKH